MKLRSRKAIESSEQYYADCIWYNRHQMLKEKVAEGSQKVDSKIWEDALKAEIMLEEKWGKDNLGPWDDFEWGEINGKLSALRWILGYDWDMLDS